MFKFIYIQNTTTNVIYITYLHFCNKLCDIQCKNIQCTVDICHENNKIIRISFLLVQTFNIMRNIKAQQILIPHIHSSDSGTSHPH